MSVLHIVATPIGNLEDVSLRSLRVLAEVELVLAEDTRRTRILLDRHDVKASPVSLHAHNEASRIEQALAVLDGGGDVALVSDAGTPLISDPGERLVAAAVEGGHAVSPVPGASAVLSVLCASGLPAAPFSFLGFLPRKAGECNRLLESLRDRPDTLVFFESPRRLAKTLERLATVLGDRRACVARELTKLHEEFARGSLTELATQFKEGARGEITLVVAGATARATVCDPAELDAAIRELAGQGRSSREISEALAQTSGLPKREIYARTIALKTEVAQRSDD